MQNCRRSSRIRSIYISPPQKGNEIGDQDSEETDADTFNVNQLWDKICKFLKRLRSRWCGSPKLY